MQGRHCGLGTHVQSASGSFGLRPPSTDLPTVPVGDVTKALPKAAQVFAQATARWLDDCCTSNSKLTPATTNAAKIKSNCVRVMGVGYARACMDWATGDGVPETLLAPSNVEGQARPEDVASGPTSYTEGLSLRHLIHRPTDEQQHEQSY